MICAYSQIINIVEYKSNDVNEKDVFIAALIFCSYASGR